MILIHALMWTGLLIDRVLHWVCAHTQQGDLVSLPALRTPPVLWNCLTVPFPGQLFFKVIREVIQFTAIRLISKVILTSCHVPGTMLTQTSSWEPRDHADLRIACLPAFPTRNLADHPPNHPDLFIHQILPLLTTISWFLSSWVLSLTFPFI